MQRWEIVQKQVLRGHQTSPGLFSVSNVKYSVVSCISQHTTLQLSCGTTAIFTMKMDVYCKDLEEEVDAYPEFHFQVKRIENVWQERWEAPKFSGGRGHKELEAIAKKYGGLRRKAVTQSSHMQVRNMISGQWQTGMIWR